jgi:hypothetical protein
MTTDRDFDRLARAWLDLGPDEAPERVVAAVLQAAETTPQVRRPSRWPTWRSHPMNRLTIAAVAVALVAVIGGGIMLTRGTSPSVGGPVASPSPSPAASAAIAGPVPAELQAGWAGAPRVIAGLPHSDRYRFALDSNSMSFLDDDYKVYALASDARSVPGTPDELTFVSGDTKGGCQVGDTGRYRWTLTPGSTRLTLTALTEACANRQAALAGEWLRVACKDANDGCFGTLEAGTWPSQYFTPNLSDSESWAPTWGALQYTVPDGWANKADWPDTFTLTPSADYASVDANGDYSGAFGEINLVRHPAAAVQNPACTPELAKGVASTVDGLIGYVRGLPGIKATTPTPISVDGLRGSSIDIQTAPDWKGSCLDDPGVRHAVYLTREGAPQDAYQLDVGPGERQRLIFLDLGDGQVVGMQIIASDAAAFDDFAAKAMPIIESMTFK